MKLQIKKIIQLFILLFLIQLLNGSMMLNNKSEKILLNPLFTNNMVLQQKQNIPIWGTAKPGVTLSIELANQKKSVVVEATGKWSVSLDPIDAGGPYELVISGTDVIRIENVMIGEVWICSGQSNMEMAIDSDWGKINNRKEEVRNANYPNIRLLTVNKKMATKSQENFESEGWKICSSETISEFSAVAYFYGRKLHKELNVPIGLIQTAWGGTVVEAWTSGESLKRIPEFKDIVEYLEADSSTDEERVLLAKKKFEEWPNKIEKVLKDEGTFENGFQNSDYNFKNWETMKLPTTWEDTGLEIDGVVWFNKNVEVPKSWQGKDLKLSLGRINDYDITWFNGTRVGRGTDVTYSRVYNIPSELVKDGNNKITVEVLDIGNVGGLYGPAKDMKLTNKEKSISLVGDWKYKPDPILIDVTKLPEKPSSNSGANRPTVLYNAMINPLLPYAIKGVIWYQGESNADRAYQYRKLFKTLINDWRNVWQQGDFPFYFVQLANYKKYNTQPSDDDWAELREAQTMALELPNTGMAVTIDIGDEKDIHPKNKQEVGRRLALNALAKTYGRSIQFSGPVYKSMKIDGDKIYLTFTNTKKGLKIKGGKHLEGFAVAGNDKKFVWAEAKIQGDEIVVWSSQIKNPVAVRYAWASNPICNLYNGADLPASPFRTDDWNGITFGKK